MDDLGDHVIVILEVLEAECRQQTQPMTIAESPWHYGGSNILSAIRSDQSASVEPCSLAIDR